MIRCRPLTNRLQLNISSDQEICGKSPSQNWTGIAAKYLCNQEYCIMQYLPHLLLKANRKDTPTKPTLQWKHWKMETEETNKICRKGEAVENLIADGITQLGDICNTTWRPCEFARYLPRVTSSSGASLVSRCHASASNSWSMGAALRVELVQRSSDFNRRSNFNWGQNVGWADNVKVQGGDHFPS